MVEYGIGYIQTLPAIALIYLALLVPWLLKLAFYWYLATAYLMVVVMYFVDSVNFWTAVTFSAVFSSLVLILFVAVTKLRLVVITGIAVLSITSLQLILGMLEIVPYIYAPISILLFSFLLYIYSKHLVSAFVIFSILSICGYVLTDLMRRAQWLTFPEHWQSEIEWNLISYMVALVYCAACLTAFYSAKLSFWLTDDESVDKQQ